MKSIRGASRLLGILLLTGLCVTLVVAQQFQRGAIVYEAPSKFQKITVLDTPGGHRQLLFDARMDGSDAIQSDMNKADPTELTLSYARHMITSLPLVAKPNRILVVGLGGACIQRYLYKLLPEARIDTAELDGDVLVVARKYFELKEDARQWVFIDDGRKFIEQSKDKYDLIMLDAFSATSIPYPLSTQEFLIACKARLNEGGILAANLWFGESNFHHMVKTYDAVFPEWHLMKCAGSTNVILTAFPEKRDVTAEKWMAAAAAFDKSHKSGLNLSQLIDAGFEAVTRIPTTAKILLDKDEPKGN